MSIRLAVIADIHGNLPALEAVLADLAAAGGYAVLVNLGDHASGPLYPAETLDRIIGLDAVAIRGNHERQLLELPAEALNLSDTYTRQRLSEAHWEWLRALPLTAWPHPRVFACHGSPRSDLEYLLEEVAHGTTRLRGADEVEAAVADIDADVILCGHTHLPRAVTTPSGKLIVNPGSVGVPAYVSLDNDPEPHRVETGSPHARYALLEQSNKHWRVEHRAIAYDWESMAKRAAEHNRPEWEAALRTGRIPKELFEPTPRDAPPSAEAA